ncbi:hypothetical protein QA264_00920 [Glaesserella parasuis]|uniref:hypothetical protein n=1 Tax=Glaesserella parasuis TaxID=738 RepID=UPI001365DED7|nr:hypothetical protein [Glaesserella parasuis]MDE3972335.1 hypothetical protein [Glaesserella parasuis]MDE3999837.1 hypothetical protein [Glaesserella parasuis]MDG6473732.1 hypothetical protein [Glaesserella parasuis]MDG6786191.1 hypothetical protein [Glaesserella parasuis]MDG6794477.1 hypothetical protein [Glaesserella parasuis]
MSKQFRRNQRWRMNRQMKDRRRLNLFLVEKRVRHLEGRQEVVTLDLENTHDLLTALETKVATLVAEKKAREQAEKELQWVAYPKPKSLVCRLWQWLLGMLGQKGNP